MRSAERRVAEEALRESELRLRTVIANVPVVLFALDHDGVVTLSEGRGLEVLGLEPGEAVGRSVLDLFRDRPQILEQAWRALAGEPINTTVELAGSVYEVRMSSPHAENGDIAGVVGVAIDVTERRRSEEALEETERRFATVLANARAYVYRCRNEEGYPNEFASNYALELTGYPPEDLMVGGPVRFGDLIVEEDRRRVWEEVQKALSRGERFELRYDIRRRDGEIRHVEESGQGVYDEVGGGVVAIEGIVYDVTELKRTEERLREAEARYRTLVERIPAIVYVQEATDSSAVTYVSPQIEDMLGYEPEEYTTDPEHWMRMIHPADRRRVLAEHERTGETGETFGMEYRRFASDGRVVWISDQAVLVRDEAGQPLYWLGVQHDITERRVAEEALRESELRLRTVIANVPVVLFALDHDGVVTLSEGRGLEVLGLEPGEAVGRSVSELYGGKPEILEDIDRALDGEEFSAVREIDSRTFETWYSPLRARTGEVAGVIGVATDVTERKRAEEEIREVNRRLEELAVLKADFTAMVAHELDTPLAVIRGYTDMLATGELEPAGRDRALAKIQAETDVMAALITDARTAAAIEREDFAVKPRRVPIGALMKDAFAFAETLGGDHPLVLDNASDGQVWADPYRIGQVLRNLLSNAAKYSPDGAPIELRTAPGDTPGHIRIEVSDHGAGVHPDDVNRIFEKFGRGRDRSSRRVAGVGLGLYLSRRILRTHGSDLTLNPAPGCGSVFGFELETAL